jgi:hypothetical protein
LIEFDSPGGATHPPRTPETLDDLFDSPGEISFKREMDQWNNPLVEPPPGGWPDPHNPRWQLHQKRYGNRRGYQRVSNLANVLNSGMGLTIWMARHTALQVARNEPLAALLASCRYRKEDFAIIDEAIEAAKVAGMAEEKSLSAATYGTALHRFMEPLAPPTAPVKLRADIEAYHQEKERKRVTTLETEVYVINDELETVGTFDELDVAPVCPDCGSVKLSARRELNESNGEWYCWACSSIFSEPRDAVMIGDKKTGKLHLLEQSIQLATYANSVRYDPMTGERSPIHPNLSLDWAILAHIPLGSGQCTLYPVDIKAGYVMAKVAVAAREGRRTEKDLFSLWDDLRL